MAKVTISEERLNKIIANAINEALEDEGLGRWLGNAYQWGRNKMNNFRGEFEAGRNNQRWKNRDFDPYHGMENAYQTRNFGGQQYADYRYDKTAQRNQNAVQYGPSQYRNQGQGQQPQTDEPKAAPNGNEAPQTQQQAAPQQHSQETYQNPNEKASRHSLSDLVNYIKTDGPKRIGKYDADLIVKALQAYSQSSGMQESKK